MTDIAERIEAEIAATGIPPVTHAQIAATLDSLPEPLRSRVTWPVPELTRIPVDRERDAIATAREHIHTAIASASRMADHLRADDGSQDYEMPNAGDAIVDELALALESLSEMGAQ